MVNFDPKEKTILVIDDDETIIDSVTKLFKGIGYNYIPAYSVSEACEHIGKNEFDLIIIDLNLPDSSGLDLVRLVNNMCIDIDIIIMTAHATLDSTIEAIKEHVFDYITKPFDDKKLLSIIEKSFTLQESKKTEDNHVEMLEMFNKIAVDRELQMIDLKNKLIEIQHKRERGE